MYKSVLLCVVREYEEDYIRMGEYTSWCERETNVCIVFSKCYFAHVPSGVGKREKKEDPTTSHPHAAHFKEKSHSGYMFA